MKRLAPGARGGLGRPAPAAQNSSQSVSGKPVVALVTDAIAPYHRGGKEQRYQELAIRLRDYADVHVYTMNWWGGPRTTCRGGVWYHAICPRVPLYRGERRSITEAVIFALACFRLLFARFDVLEADHMPYLQLFPLKLVAIVRRKRLVVTWHEVWDLSQWRNYIGTAGILSWCLEQLAMHLPDCIIAASTHTAEALSRRDPRAPVVVAPNGVDLDLIDEVAPAEDPVEIVSVGRLLAHKRFDLLLECVAIFAQRGTPVRCRIIGDGQERAALAQRTRELGVEHLVELRHDVDTSEELISLIKAARVFAFPSEREGFGIAALEAIACGIPVVTTTAPHNLARHLVARSVRGIVCEPTASALADAVSHALRALDPTGEPEEWIREFDWTAMSARIAGALGAQLPLRWP
jgi:glycosyltransferase involved in cell wall biosynthesis